MSDINIGALSEAINDKMDRDAQNVDTTAGADVVVAFQVPTSSNNYTWYRKYKSGWVEQGGYVSVASDTLNYTVNLPVTMQNDKYAVTGNVTNSSAWTSDEGTSSKNSVALRACCTNRHSTTLFYLSYVSSAYPVFWTVSGMAA